MAKQRKVSIGIVAMIAVLSISSGCSIYRHAVPAYCIGQDTPNGSREDREPINFLRLRQDPPDAYRLDARDVLGIYIEGVLGSKDEPPPVHFPETGDLPPAIGYPVAVREDGTISLPLLPPIHVGGLTLTEAEQKIRMQYIDRKILKANRERIMVTLMRPRTFHVLVVREDTATTNPNIANSPNLAQALLFGTMRRGQTFAIDLRAYENDVLHALSETGGLPGSDALNEIVILRNSFSTPEERDQYMQTLNNASTHAELLNSPNAIRIPLRQGPFDPISEFSQKDIVLNNGDVVFVQTRETEIFYTGGLLPGGQWPLPRDYDIDVLEAMAMAGGSVASGAGSGDGAFGRGGGGIGPLLPATRVIVLRPMGSEQVPIEVDLRRAMLDSQERVIIQPGDFIVLEYTNAQLFTNILLSSFRLNWFLN